MNANMVIIGRRDQFSNLVKIRVRANAVEGITTILRSIPNLGVIYPFLFWGTFIMAEPPDQSNQVLPKDMKWPDPVPLDTQ